MKPYAMVLPAPLAAALACSSASPMTYAQYRQQVENGLQRLVAPALRSLSSSAQALQAAAPTPAGRGWDATLDASAIAAMETAWIGTRTAYERVEPVTAALYPAVDFTIDARYEDFLAALPPTATLAAGDSYLFDAAAEPAGPGRQGVTGMHAIERILYSNVTPASVIAYESTLAGYVAAAFPGADGNLQEASDFKALLVQKLVDDATALSDATTSSGDAGSAAGADIGTLFAGLVSSVSGQRDKLTKAAAGQEESRYSRRTMADLRDNLAGAESVYKLFQPWLRSKRAAPGDGGDASASDASAADAGAAEDGADVDAAIEQGFAALDALYAAVAGDALPQAPADWSSSAPTAPDLATPFGQLFAGVQAAADPAQPGSIVAEMTAAGVLLGFPQFTE